MAYASLLSLTQTLEQILHPLDQSLALNHTQQQLIRSLHGKINFLVDFLDVISPKSNENISRFEGRIRDAAYEVENKIESNMSNQIVSEWEQVHEGLQKVLGELTSISEDLVKMKERNDIEILKQKNTFPSARSTQSWIVGIQDKRERILNSLIGSSSELLVVTIFGMGGIGKTTLAREIYKDTDIVTHFDIRGWVMVSQNCDERDVVLYLLYSVKDLLQDLSSKESVEKLAEDLYKRLKDKRYLIVLDDVCDVEILLKIKSLLPRDSNGSRILITSRVQDVGIKADHNSIIHQMGFLSAEHSFGLLQEMVFGKERCPPELEDLGKKITNNCEGHPLSLILVGGVLYKSEKTRDYWKYVAERTESESFNSLDFVSFCYDQLPHHLRACFLYMGFIPQAYRIRTSKTIKFWVANRFIKPHRSKSLEEVANEYLQDLIDRNLLTVYRKTYSGKIKFCSIHVVLRDFCLMKTKGKFNSDVNYLPEVLDNIRHVSIHRNNLENLIPKFDLADNGDLHFRSVIIIHHVNPNDIHFITRFRLLRVLDALEISFDEFPVEIIEVKTLRFIALTYWAKHRIPSSISKLCNLETLIIRPGKLKSIFNSSFLPPEIWKMPRLRHIIVVTCFLPYPTDVLNGGNIVPLENLHTLANVVNFRWTKEVLQMMPNLKKLLISYKHDGRTEWSSYCFNNFAHLLQLEVLKCFFFSMSYIKYQDPLPVNFAFPAKLKRLTLSGCRISWKNMTIIGSLSNLQVLKLKYHAFEGPVWETNDGEFRQLKLLLIHMTDLENWKVDEMHFPSLERLCLKYCYNLVEIPSVIGNVPTLQKIELCECNTSVVTSAKNVEEKQTNFGNDKFEVVVLENKGTDVSS